jgi:hypothetical protein
LSLDNYVRPLGKKGDELLADRKTRNKKKETVIFEIKMGLGFLNFLGGWFLMAPPKDKFAPRHS